VVDINGLINVNGNPSELPISYDGVLMTNGYTEITTMDVTDLYPGDIYSFNHTFYLENSCTKSYSVVVTLDNRTAFDDPLGIWYGFNISISPKGENYEVQSFVLNPGEYYNVTYRYAVDPLFVDPGMPYPFSLIYDIDLIE